MSSIYEHRCIQLFEVKLPTAERGPPLIAVQKWMSSALCVNTGPSTAESVASSVVFRSVTLWQPPTRLPTVPTHKTCHNIRARVSLPKLILKIYFFLTVKYQNSYPNESSRSICLVSNFVLLGGRWEN